MSNDLERLKRLNTKLWLALSITVCVSVFGVIKAYKIGCEITKDVDDSVSKLVAMMAGTQAAAGGYAAGYADANSGRRRSEKELQDLCNQLGVECALKIDEKRRSKPPAK